MNKPLSIPTDRKKPGALILPALTAAAATALILAVVYIVRGIWPFGTDNVSYVDTAQFFVPDYYAVWDVMHGLRSAALNWFEGLSETGTASWSALLTTNIDWTIWLYPANWGFLLVARDHILEYLSFYLMIGMAMAAFVAALMLRLRFPRLPAYKQVLFGLVYAFSGYVLQYYCSLGWFIVIILFPVLLYALDRLLRDGKCLLFVVIYGIFLYRNIYFSFMATIYVLLYSFAYWAFLLPKELRKDRIIRLGLSAVAALGITCFFWSAGTADIFGTDRFQSNLDSGLLSGLSTWDITYTRHTVLMLLGTELTAAVCICSLVRSRLLPETEREKQKKALKFFGFILIALLIPVVFTNIDTAWHFGQYNFFPMRYGFMLPATLIAAAAALSERDELYPVNVPEDSRGRTVLRAVLAVCAAAVAAFLVPKLENYFITYGCCFLQQLAGDYWKYFALLVGCAALLVLLYVLVLRFKHQKLSAVLLCLVLALQLGANGCGLVASNDDRQSDHAYDPAYVENADAVYDYFSGQDISPLVRAKNADDSMNAGYSNLAGISAVSSVNSFNSSSRLAFFGDLGYSTHYFRLLDTGGTVFSDMLFGVQYSLTASEPDDSLYTWSGDTAGDIYIGTSNYPGRIGLLYRTGALDGYDACETIADRLNLLYDAFTETEDTLAFTPEYTLTSEGEGLMTYTLSCTTDTECLVYLSTTRLIMNIVSDGRNVTVPAYQNLNNTLYPTTFDSGLLYMGSFAAGTTEITFSSSIPLTEDDLTVVALETSRLDSFYDDAVFDENISVTADKTGLDISVTAPEDGCELFLPLTADDSWTCTVNGQQVPITECLGQLMSIPLSAGENVIRLECHAAVGGGALSAAVSVLCLAAVVVWLIISRRRKELQTRAFPSGLCSAAQVLFLVLCGAMCLYIYVLPTVLLIAKGTIVRF